MTHKPVLRSLGANIFPGRVKSGNAVVGVAVHLSCKPKQKLNEHIYLKRASGGICSQIKFMGLESPGQWVHVRVPRRSSAPTVQCNSSAGIYELIHK